MQYFRFKYLLLSSFSSTACPLDTLPFGTLLPVSSDQKYHRQSWGQGIWVTGRKSRLCKTVSITPSKFFIQSSYGHLHLREPIARHETGFEEQLLKRKGQSYPTSWAGVGAERTAEWHRSRPGAPGPRSNSLYQHQRHLNHPQATRKAITVICHAKHMGKSFAIGQEFTNNMYFLKKKCEGLWEIWGMKYL